MSTVQEIGEPIEHLDVREQIRLLQDLPVHLKIQPDDVAWLKAAEPAFEFWNNPEDAMNSHGCCSHASASRHVLGFDKSQRGGP